MAYDWLNNRFFRQPLQPSFKRRAWFHNYLWKSKYMITIEADRRFPPLSNVVGDPFYASSSDGKEIEHSSGEGKLSFSREDMCCPDTDLSVSGECVMNGLREWCSRWQQIRLDGVVIMPDHIHLCIDVMETLPKHLGQIMAQLKGLCTSMIRERLASDTLLVHRFEKYCGSRLNLSEISLFTQGFCDSIAFDDKRYRAQRDYILDNPRRYLLKKKYPNLFRERHIIKIDGVAYEALGNIGLLRFPELIFVKYYSKLDEAANDANFERWKQGVANGAVLISPFINGIEKKGRDWAIANGGRYIRICENGWSERWAPSKREFDLMAEGRLLLIAPSEFDSHRKDITKKRATELNNLCARISSGEGRYALPKDSIGK